MKERRRGCFLPQDFQYDILTRLPTKSLLRVKSVCKQWCNLISDSNFSKLHLEKSERPGEGHDVFVQPMNVATEEFMANIPVPCPPQDSFLPPGN
ncbi:hypothetical protein Pint_30949 [Pistacia integerrima]|uniref:Uncharacterized protein n=1 Tax=Pistacia integerrima TaxID=434235 RepID=A0ACC0XPL5_9ROSI|nr:hypothetical protein Pint_30949 [Pistacia integerrima]